MPPKFQSSFIPKGPVSVMPDASDKISRPKHRDLISTIAVFIFALSILSGLGVFLYKGWLNYRIETMNVELDRARATISPETVNELIRLDNRIVSTARLVDKHRVLSPLFDLLESSTLANVRFTEFDYILKEGSPELSLKGEATSYATLALEADMFNKNPYFMNPVFSDFNLDERGNVIFSMKTKLDSELLSYKREVEALFIPEVIIPVQQATSTPSGQVATSTSPN